MFKGNLPVVLVDDEPLILEVFAQLLDIAGINNIRTFTNSTEVMPYLATQGAALVMLDLHMPNMTGFELLKTIGESFPQIPVVVITGAMELETAVECMKLGASDYLVKPVDEPRFIGAVRKALEINELRSEVSSLRERMLASQLKRPDAFSEIITQSPRMFSVFRYIEAIATSKQPVLITGETGVGKELVARALHRISGRSGQYVAVNVAGLDDTMFSDTIFGHERGAFTGADKSRSGMVQQAADGVLFLDEIGDMSESSQVKLLRLLQEQTYYPLGCDRVMVSSARIVTATNQNLEALMNAGKFRKDLYYRLCAHHVDIPPLRERHEDIPLLVDYYIAEAAASMSKKKPPYGPHLLNALANYSYAGNVRELQAVVYDAVARHQSGQLSVDSFVSIMKSTVLDIHENEQLPEAYISCSFNRFPTLKEIEDYMIGEALRLSGGNRSVASTMLGITRQSLYQRLNRNLPSLIS